MNDMDRGDWAVLIGMIVIILICMYADNKGWL